MSAPDANDKSNNNKNATNDEKEAAAAAKKARKVALKAEAATMGITYDELKERKRECKKNNKNKQKREAEQLENVEHQADMKRMRTWSKDFDDPTTKKRNITRSMDETLLATPDEQIEMSAEEWRSLHDIRVQGHGDTSRQQQQQMKFPDPYLKFTDAPFCAAIQKSFAQAGFDKPTHIQSQVCTVLLQHGHDISCIILCM